ncbi:MAG TPA: DUF2460 domain-containing protein [Candidatus Sulfotelmatobacter sp.]|jgi:uncharacterized protein (TIGR02217 family)
MDIFPVLPGLTWSVTKSPKFATRIQTSISGREVRVIDQIYPIWTWQLIYSFLRDHNDQSYGPALGAGYDELRTLAGFFLRQQGSFQTFLYQDPTDTIVTNQVIGTGDGTTAAFQLVRTFGGFTEPITQPFAIAIFVNGVVAPYTQGLYGAITMSSVPNPGAVVTANFSYTFPVRFTTDMLDFENFMFQLWELKKLAFQSVLLP